MEITRYRLWDETPGTTAYEPWIEHYKPEKALNDSALVIIPGSGYAADPDRPKQEGERVAKHYCEMGINVFCLRYRVSPDYQILCYPVIGFDRENYYIHQGSPGNLLGDINLN